VSDALDLSFLRLMSDPRHFQVTISGETETMQGEDDLVKTGFEIAGAFQGFRLVLQAIAANRSLDPLEQLLPRILRAIQGLRNKSHK